MLILVPNTNESVRLLPSDFPAENPRTQNSSFHTRAVGNKLKKENLLPIW